MTLSVVVGCSEPTSKLYWLSRHSLTLIFGVIPGSGGGTTSSSDRRRRRRDSRDNNSGGGLLTILFVHHLRTIGANSPFTSLASTGGGLSHRL